MNCIKLLLLALCFLLLNLAMKLEDGNLNLISKY